MSAVPNVVALEAADASSDLLRVSDGDYLAVYVGHTCRRMFGGVKLRVDFRLLAHPGVILSRWYRITSHHAGRTCAGVHSDIVRELSAILGRRVRHDRVPVTCLENVVVRVAVHTTCTDARQRIVAEINRYSTIERLVGREE